jgi:beta-N-acetylhexosaminidase
MPKLSVAQLAGQRVIYSYTGHTPPARLLSLISHGEAGGVIFFEDNFGTPAQFAAVVRKLDRAAASKLDPVHLPLLLMTDQEGGVVRRLPGPPELSARQDGHSANPQAAARQAGSGAAANLRSFGLNVNLAPVLDVYRQAGNFIDQYGRSFSIDPATVATLGAAYAAAEQQGGVAATGKHFPGLGAAGQPQDTDLRPVSLPLSASAIRDVDELPYHSVIAAQVKLVMLSWASYPALDPGRPAGLSATIVQGELRKRLGFTGVTITDALEAGALRRFGSIANRAALAAQAGMDLLLCSRGSVAEGESAMNSLHNAYMRGSLTVSAFRAADERILALRSWLASAAKS